MDPIPGRRPLQVLLERMPGVLGADRPDLLPHLPERDLALVQLVEHAVVVDVVQHLHVDDTSSGTLSNRSVLVIRSNQTDTRMASRITLVLLAVSR